MLTALKSHSNAYSVFISREGYGTFAGSNTLGNASATLRSGGVPEKTVAYPIRPICRIRPILPLRSPTCYRPIIRPENKGIKPNSGRHKPKSFHPFPPPPFIMSILSKSLCPLYLRGKPTLFGPIFLQNEPKLKNL